MVRDSLVKLQLAEKYEYLGQHLISYRNMI